MHGYRTNLWTTAGLAELISHQFGVQYHRDHVGRLMHSLSWSPQKPERRALERSDEAIAQSAGQSGNALRGNLTGTTSSSVNTIGLEFSHAL